jgi:hypothetical protein
MDSADQASLQNLFRACLPELKAKTRVPILLPAEAPSNLLVKGLVIDANVSDDAYDISLVGEHGAGNAGFMAGFSASARKKAPSLEVPSDKMVSLPMGISAVFRPISCGGSCAPVNIWWGQEKVVYQIQLKMLSDTGEEEQEVRIVALASSAIKAGPL